MGGSRSSGSGSVSVDVERISFGGKEHQVRTRCGSSVCVAVYGDQDKPALVTYPDVALNYMSCFQGLFLCPETASLLLHNFCIYHINPQGHELGAAPVQSDVPVPSVDDLADQVADVLDFFSLGSAMCLGVTAGAYVLTLFATKYHERVIGLMLVSPLCKAPAWSEWLYNKLLLNLLYYYGTRGLVKECLLQRYFSKEIRGNAHCPESYIVQACRTVCILLISFRFYRVYRDANSGSELMFLFMQLLGERQGESVWRFLHSMNKRHDLTDALRKLRCRTLIFVGENSQFHDDAIHVTTKLDRRYCALVEVQGCGSLVTEEQPQAMLMPMEYFLKGYGLRRPPSYQVSNSSPRGPLSPCRISPELLSPESMGVKLKPIKTRISVDF